MAGFATFPVDEVCSLCMHREPNFAYVRRACGHRVHLKCVANYYRLWSPPTHDAVFSCDVCRAPSLPEELSIFAVLGDWAAAEPEPSPSAIAAHAARQPARIAHPAPSDIVIRCCPRLHCIDGVFTPGRDRRMQWSPHRGEEAFVCMTCNREVQGDDIRQYINTVGIPTCIIHGPATALADMKDGSLLAVCSMQSVSREDLPEIVRCNMRHVLQPDWTTSMEAMQAAPHVAMQAAPPVVIVDDSAARFHQIPANTLIDEDSSEGDSDMYEYSSAPEVPDTELDDDSSADELHPLASSADDLPPLDDSPPMSRLALCGCLRPGKAQVNFCVCFFGVSFFVFRCFCFPCV